ncbi:putative DUF654-domain-containing protein [Lyophyllum shimeji]|uniref:DUF654-domain-containing protein n=1 Tax=Lyophyllum shimeji TaxID=47721 RepID=A0A9P3PCW8_LYOSH|nr:putative DUF654-domain-containing protein [Lyophyllum shimeji]
MPPRLNKRQQRELEELQALGGPSNLDASSDDEPVRLTKSTPAIFSNFLAPEEVESLSEDEGSPVPHPQQAKSRKKKKTKKKNDAAPAPSPAPALAPTPAAAPAPTAPTPTPKSEKKALKKAKARQKKAGADKNAGEEEDIEQVLAELSIKYPSLQTPSPSTHPTASPSSLASLLAVSPAHLDPEAEMRKFFGARVIQASKSSASPASLAVKRRQRSNLTRPQPTWWSASQREGLSLRALSAEEVSEMGVGVGVGDGEARGEKWWTVESSQRYKSMTKLFIQAVMSGHPDALWEVQRKLPWHADNLLQLAEIYRHREEYAQAVDFVDRALFTYERAFIGAFTFTSGTNRLDFRRVENRPFYLAVHRTVGDLQRRGCPRTAFEFARLLYALDPWTDPHGAVYHLEMLALKSGMGGWLVEVWEHFRGLREARTEMGMKEKETGEARMDPSVLPGWAYARALAMRMREDAEGDTDHAASTAALEDALVSFPSVVPLLADKLDVALPAHIRAHRDFRIEPGAGTLPAPTAALHALSHMYATRSFGLWKAAPSHGAWFRDTATRTFAALSASSSAPPVPPPRQAFLALFSSPVIQESLYRHLTVSESTGGGAGRLAGWIPRDVVAEAHGGLACDPLPPGRAVSRYDEVYFSGVEDIFVVRRGGAQRRMDERMLEGVIGDAGVRRRVMEILDNLGGGEGLAAMLERMGPEAVEDVLGQVQAMVMAEDQGGMRMPGEMPGAGGCEGGRGGRDRDRDRDRDGEEDESESESDEEAPTAVQRVLRGILGRFWGGGRATAAGGGDETSEDEEPVDRAGVD